MNISDKDLEELTARVSRQFYEWSKEIKADRAKPFEPQMYSDEVQIPVGTKPGTLVQVRDHDIYPWRAREFVRYDGHNALYKCIVGLASTDEEIYKYARIPPDRPIILRGKPHDGGPAPIPRGLQVLVIFRSGNIDTGYAGDFTSWVHKNNKRDIVFYYELPEEL